MNEKGEEEGGGSRKGVLAPKETFKDENRIGELPQAVNLPYNILCILGELIIHQIKVNNIQSRRIIVLEPLDTAINIDPFQPILLQIVLHTACGHSLTAPPRLVSPLSFSFSSRVCQLVF